MPPVRSELPAGSAAALRWRPEVAVRAGPGRRGTRPAGPPLRLPQQAAAAPVLPGHAAGGTVLEAPVENELGGLH